MSQLSAGLRRSLRKIAKMFNGAPKVARKPAAPKWHLEELEQRDVPATFYVATTGSDSAAGGSANPWRTLQYAADRVAAGDTVIVRSGTYSGFTLYTDGTAANRIVFDADPGVTINARSSTTAASHGAINLEGADYVTVDGFNVVMATTGSVNSNIRSVGNTGAIIRNNTIDNAKVWGILTGFSENVLIENNTISDTQEQHGIYVGNSADNPIIRGNTVTNSRLCGIQINSDRFAGGDGIITGALVEGNTLLNNANFGGASVNFDGVQNSVLRNNVIYGSRNGIALYKTDGAEGAKNNKILGNTIVFPANVGFWAVSIVGGSTGTKLFNNVLYRQASGSYGSIGIDPDCVTGFESDYNAVVDKFNRNTFNDAPVTFAQWKAQTGQDAHSFLATPAQLFVDPANHDYRLKAGSPAINAGINRSDLTTDILGNSRPSGGATDVGAYEYQSAPAGASQFEVGAPSTATAGGSFTVTVTARDSSGNVATGYTGTVRFTSSDAQATLPANYTFTASDAGAKTFTVTLKTAGARTVVATDTTTGSITGTDTVTVSAAAASTAQLSAPSTATAGASFTATVTLKDAFGNTATGYRGTMRFTSTDTQATLPANYTFTAGDAGVKALAVTLRTAGARTVTVTDTTTSSIAGTANTTVSTSNPPPPRPARKTLTAVGSAPGAPSALYVFDGDTGALRLATPSPFGGTGGLKVAVGDVNNDGFDDAILTPATGVGGGRVMVLSGRDFGVLANYTLAPGFGGFAGGVNVAAGDVNGDGTDDVILGAAARSDAVVVLSGATQNLLMVKFAFGGLGTGVTVAAGDFDGDGRADVVAGTATAYAFAAVYSGASQQMLLTSLPLGLGYTAGISVAAGDLNGDRRADLVMGLNSFGAAITVDTATGGAAVRFAYPGQNVGVSVSTTDRNGDGIAEVVTAAVGRAAPLVRVFSGPSFALVTEFFAFQPGFALADTGLYVAGSTRR
jgi:parallel beta-helix repeat protein